MTESALTADRILDAAEECLRRFGPQKTTVVDVARALKVTHGAIYRHYVSKESLREAVISRWLERDEAALCAISDQATAAPERLRAWLDHMIANARQRVQKDPQMFETYHELVKDVRNLRELIDHHLTELQNQLAHIIKDGVAAGQFNVDDPQRAARAVFFATVPFHHPLHLKMRAECDHTPDMEVAYRDVLDLILAGLGLRAQQ